MKKYILITTTSVSIKYELFEHYDDLLYAVYLIHERYLNAITKWYRVDNITYDKLDAIVGSFSKFVSSMNKGDNYGK